MVKVGVEAAGPLPSGLLDRELFGTPEQRVFLARARAFVRFSATQRASLIGMQEWKARGPAAALAAELGAPVHPQPSPVRRRHQAARQPHGRGCSPPGPTGAAHSG